MRIGIIRCQDHSNICPGHNCFPASYQKTGEFSRYDSVEIAGFETCGGCCRGKPTRIVNRALRLKHICGAEAIHLSNCLMQCPNKNVYKKAIAEKTGLPVVEGTHPPNSPEAAAALMAHIAAYAREAEPELSPLPQGTDK
jgi:predicted metal-binding protein